MDTLRVYEPGSDEHKRLEAAAKLVEAFTGIPTNIETTYFDYGSRWQYTSLNAACSSMSAKYQAADPKQYEALVQGTFEEYTRALEEIIRSVKRRSL